MAHSFVLIQFGVLLILQLQLASAQTYDDYDSQWKPLSCSNLGYSSRCQYGCDAILNSSPNFQFTKGCCAKFQEDGNHLFCTCCRNGGWGGAVGHSSCSANCTVRPGGVTKDPDPEGYFACVQVIIDYGGFYGDIYLAGRSCNYDASTVVPKFLSKRD